MVSHPLSFDVLGFPFLRDQVEEVGRQEEGVDGVADEAVAVGRSVRRLAHDAQHALVAVWVNRRH